MIFTLLRDANKPLVPGNVQLTDTELAQNTITVAGVQRFVRLPQRLISPYTSALIKNFFPQDASPSAPINPTNGRLVDYYTNAPGRVRRHLGTMRVDHDFSENDQMNVVFNIQENTQATAPVVSPFTGLGLTQNDRSNRTLSISETHLFSPAIINEIRGGFNSQPNFRRSNQTLREFLQTIGFNEADIQAYGATVTPNALDTFGHPTVNFGTGFQNFTNGGRNTFRPLDVDLFTIGDTLTWIKGKHTMRGGADIVRNHAKDGFTSGRGSPRGVVNYTGAGPDAFARFLMGLPANTITYVNQFRPEMDVSNWEQGYFIQDDFKIHPRPTLNMGLRYEIITTFTEKNDLLVNFDPNFVSSTGRKGQFIIPSDKALPFVDPRYIAYGTTTADQRGLPVRW